MIVCENPKFIFVAVPKAGSTSIEDAFCRKGLGDCDIVSWNNDVDILTPTNKSFPNFGKHTRAFELKSSVNGYSDYFSFAFVRNPWDRVVSYYTMVSGPFSVDAVWRDLSFEVFVKHWTSVASNGPALVHSKTIKPGFYPEITQQTIISDTAGNLLVDYVGMFELLQEGFNVVCNRLGIKISKLDYTNVSEHKQYREYYNDLTKDLIYDSCKWEIEKFGYMF